MRAQNSGGQLHNFRLHLVQGILFYLHVLLLLYPSTTKAIEEKIW